MPRACLIILLAAACPLLSACGDSTSSSRDPASIAPAYIASANAICTRQLARLNGLTMPVSAEAAVSYLPRALSILHAETHQLEAIDPPASGRAQFADALAGERQLTALLGGFLHELQTGLVELSAFAHVQARGNALRAEIDSHFRRAGLARCAN